MKIFNWLILLCLAGCQQLTSGQQQPVRTNPKGDYYTTCGGAVETWGSCNDKAQKTCQGNYSVVKKEEDGTGMKRELTFQCNK